MIREKYTPQYMKENMNGVFLFCHFYMDNILELDAINLSKH